PHESYWDRKTSARIGIYDTQTEDIYYPYIRPQENGYRTDVRWVALYDNNKNGLLFEANNILCFNAQYYTKDNYCNEKKKVLTHQYDMQKTDDIHLNIDYGQMGVGGDNSWRDLVHTEYTLLQHEYYYSFTIKPFNSDNMPKVLNTTK
ncbi:MAG: glycoside hydrolase family 2, partial [Bacteroidales bacterium]|nr:glycoside hydrolase family 2 [Bacteroidales bacterium]